MAANTSVENVNVIAATMGTGAAWCKVSATQYFPMVSYSVTGAVRSAVCPNSASNCMNAAAWSPATVVATGNVISKLLVDATVAGDVPKVATWSGTNLQNVSDGNDALQCRRDGLSSQCRPR